MLLCLTLLLLMGLSVCTVAGDKELALSTETGSWVTMTQEVSLKRGRGWSMVMGAEDPLVAARRAGWTLKANCLTPLKATAPGLTEPKGEESESERHRGR